MYFTRVAIADEASSTGALGLARAEVATGRLTMARIDVVARVDNAGAVIHIGVRVIIDCARDCAAKTAESTATGLVRICKRAVIKRQLVQAAVDSANAAAVRVGRRVIIELVFFHAPKSHRDAAAVVFVSRWVVVKRLGIDAARNGDELAPCRWRAPFIGWIGAAAGEVAQGQVNAIRRGAAVVSLPPAGIDVA